MARKTAAPTPQISRLELLHKGIYPAIAICVAVGALVVSAFNVVSQHRMQREIEGLQKEAQESAARVQQAEAKAQALREEFCEELLSAPAVSRNTGGAKGWANVTLGKYMYTGDETEREFWKQAEKAASEKLKKPRPTP